MAAPGGDAAAAAAAGGVAGLGPFVLARSPSPPTPLLSLGGGGGSSRPRQSGWAPGAGGGGGERASRPEWGAMAKLRVAYEYTEAEDKSIRLGLFLIISGVVSLFIFGFCWLSPALQDLQATAANCTVLSVQQIGEVFECTFTCGADCRGTSQYPCVQVYVNNSESNSKALLHSDEHQLLTNPKVSALRTSDACLLFRSAPETGWRRRRPESARAGSRGGERGPGGCPGCPAD